MKPRQASLIGTNGREALPDGKFASREGAMIIIQNGAINQLAIPSN